MLLKDVFKIMDLKESTFFKGKLNLFKNNDEITILKDPSSKTLKSLFDKGDVRGLYTSDTEEFYFWHAETLNHYGFFQKFGFGDDDSDICFILSKNEIKFPQWMVHPKEFGIENEDKLWNIKCDIELITNDNKIKSLYPNGFKIGVSY